MPWFFQFTENGRKGNTKTLPKPNDGENISTMNRIALRFEPLNKEKLKIDYSTLGDLNPWMLLRTPNPKYNPDVYPWYDSAIACALSYRRQLKQNRMRSFDNSEDYIKDNEWWDRTYEKLKEFGLEKFDEDTIYDSLVCDMFMGKGIDKACRKENFWMMYGDKAIENIEYNLKHSHKCEKEDCHMLVPDWDINHENHHQGEDKSHKKCILCDKIFTFHNNNEQCCPKCAIKYKANKRREYHKEFKDKEMTKRLEYVKSNIKRKEFNS